MASRGSDVPDADGADPHRASRGLASISGRHGDSSTSQDLPAEFSADPPHNVAWTTPLPGRAVNGPIVVGDHVFATSSSGHGQERLHVFCLDQSSGEVVWERKFWATGRTLCHPLSAVAAATPASDGRRVFALFSSNDLMCLDLEGNLQWVRALGQEYPNAFDDRGLASSPCVMDNMVVVQVACSGDSFAMGVDAPSGVTKWYLPLAKSTNWASPTPVEFHGRRLIMLQSAERLLFVDASSGATVHTLEAEGQLIPSPTLTGDTILLPAAGMTAVRFSAGPESEAEVMWQSEKVAAEAPSPVAQNDHFFVIRPPSILTAASVSDGEVIWKKRLKGSSFWATPLLNNDRLYVTNTEGLVQVVAAADGEVLAENDLSEEILGSPAAAHDALFFRSTSSVMKVQALEAGVRKHGVTEGTEQ